ncbi:translocase subunit secA 1 domain protein [Mycobacterium ulcerans str. Harvey]|uniref:Translocase subunit secA 1 domain protein n=1 Tax=Mycobacterium ulcerans str. Harvey TaxID=1299332 RepID=A0ABN0R8P1_MYCUL|nr:translocase subunit secA 1 domain protein [Mycobacterium ulcerans str. Harvey]
MTGTAQTEAAELHEIYKLGVVPIPTNRPMVREDQSDLIYKTEEAKYIAVVDDVAERYEKGQPVLIGTTSVERSEYLSGSSPNGAFRTTCSTPSTTSRKRHHRRGGPAGAITVATNMAAAVPTSCWAETSTF